MSSTTLALGESVSLVWDPNSEPDLAGYRLYYGTASRTYNRTVEVSGNTSVTVDDLELGTMYYFAVTAFNTAGLESDFSNEVTYQPQAQPNRPPYALELDLVAASGQPTTITLSGFDPDNDALTYAIVAGPQHGSITGSAPQLTYTPQAGFLGVDGFSYTVSDGQAVSDPAEVTITVTSDPNPPPTYTPPKIVDALHLGYGLVLTWTSEPGLTYRVVARDGFGDSTWEPLSEGILAGGLRTSWLDPVSTMVSARLYSVELIMP